MKVYLLSEAEDPSEETFVNFSGSKMNTIHANDATYFDELNAIVQPKADALRSMAQATLTGIQTRNFLLTHALHLEGKLDCR